MGSSCTSRIPTPESISAEDVRMPVHMDYPRAAQNREMLQAKWLASAWISAGQTSQAVAVTVGCDNAKAVAMG
jgi:hypothetical protein